MSPPVGARARDLSNRLMVAWPTPDASGWRQLPFTALVVVITVIILLLSEDDRPALLAAGVAGILVVQALASLAHPARWPPAWQIVLPLGQMAAIGLLDLGSGDPSGSVIVLLFVPGVSLALAPGGRPLAAGLVGVAVVAAAPVLLLSDRTYPLLHSTITGLLVGALMLHIHAIMETSRIQARQLRSARDLMRSIMLAATEQAIMATDADGRVMAVSTGAERLFEVPAERLVGADLARLIDTTSLPDGPGTTPDQDGTEDDATALSRLVGTATHEGSYVSQWRHALGGSQRLVEYIVTPRPSTDPDPDRVSAGYLVVATDVTEREEETRRQDQFLGLVSHELRTPLVSILGYVDLLRLDPAGLSDEQRGYVDVLSRNARRLRALVDELLLNARLVAGDPMSTEDVDVVDVVRGAIADVRPMADAADVACDLTGDPTVPLISDPQRLGQVVDNLLTNAVKYSHAGGRVRVEVVADLAPDGSRAARISVSDNGTGIAPDELRRITEPFYRSRDTRRRRVAGVGLGLTLVQALVAEHAGTLRINSEAGSGTEVVIQLPDAPGTRDAAPD